MGERRTLLIIRHSNITNEVRLVFDNINETNNNNLNNITMSNQELITQALTNMSNEEKALIFPPITRKNFVVRKSWLGRNQTITFVNNKNQVVTYNHDEVLKVMLPKLNIMPCWIKRGYWSQSTNLPTNVRHLAEIVELEVEESK
jgi:hypothetical protein